MLPGLYLEGDVSSAALLLRWAKSSHAETGLLWPPVERRGPCASVPGTCLQALLSFRESSALISSLKHPEQRDTDTHHRLLSAELSLMLWPSLLSIVQLNHSHSHYSASNGHGQHFTFYQQNTQNIKNHALTKLGRKYQFGVDFFQ